MHGMAGVGMGLAVALAVTSLAETVVDSHYWFAMCRLELRTKVSSYLHNPSFEEEIVSYLLQRLLIKHKQEGKFMEMERCTETFSFEIVSFILCIRCCTNQRV